MSISLFRAVSSVNSHFKLFFCGSSLDLRFAVMQNQFTITARTLIEGSDLLIWGRSKELIHINEQLFQGYEFKELFDEVVQYHNINLPMTL
jgi:hypothetical protein